MKKLLLIIIALLINHFAFSQSEIKFNKCYSLIIKDVACVPCDCDDMDSCMTYLTLKNIVVINENKWKDFKQSENYIKLLEDIINEKYIYKIKTDNTRLRIINNGFISY